MTQPKSVVHAMLQTLRLSQTLKNQGISFIREKIESLERQPLRGRCPFYTGSYGFFICSLALNKGDSYSQLNSDVIKGDSIQEHESRPGSWFKTLALWPSQSRIRLYRWVTSRTSIHQLF
ncbi:hypothetical protein K501DRAFT_337054 [Backusella circina FSU 941]|nr:hypothetical protein K501DRAFT_337054 [Backusella circina FSU 941]